MTFVRIEVGDYDANECALIQPPILAQSASIGWGLVGRNVNAVTDKSNLIGGTFLLTDQFVDDTRGISEYSRHPPVQPKLETRCERPFGEIVIEVAPAHDADRAEGQESEWRANQIRTRQEKMNDRRAAPSHQKKQLQAGKSKTKDFRRSIEPGTTLKRRADHLDAALRNIFGQLTPSRNTVNRNRPSLCPEPRQQRYEMVFRSTPFKRQSNKQNAGPDNLVGQGTLTGGWLNSTSVSKAGVPGPAFSPLILDPRQLSMKPPHMARTTNPKRKNRNDFAKRSLMAMESQ